MSGEITFLYYKKPGIGTIAFRPNGADSLAEAPVQLIFDPTCGIGVGIPLKRSTIDDKDDDNNTASCNDVVVNTTNNSTANDGNNNNNNNNNNQNPHVVAVICTGPEETIMDKHHIRAISFSFICLAIINFILTIIMFHHVSRLDASLVVAPAIPADHPNVQVPSNFQLIPKLTNSDENMNFSFILLNLILGMVSVYKGNSLGISIYCIVSVFNFIFATSALANVIFSLRYVLDAFLLYFALIIRARVVYNFLPVHVRLD